MNQDGERNNHTMMTNDTCSPKVAHLTDRPIDATDGRVLGTTQSFCRECNSPVPASLLESAGKVYLRRECPRHGFHLGLVCGDTDWYHRIVSFASAFDKPKHHKADSDRSCPLDCGLCGSHRQRMYLPVVSITSKCNLACPVCYTVNRNRDPFFMSTEEFARILEVIQEHDPGLQIINFTGGEPTMHPDLPRMVEMCREAGMHRITISTNGLRFLDDPELLPRLTESRARIVLSFNSFHSHPYVVTAGRDLLEEKLRVLELLGKYRPATSLLSVVMSGVNDHEIGAIVRYVLDSDFIVSSQIHPVTYTGQATDRFDRATRITTPEIVTAITADSLQIQRNDFLPSPCAHPLCYANCYLLKLENGDSIPLPRFIPESGMFRLLAGNFYMEPNRETEEVLNEAVNELWSRSTQNELDLLILSTLRQLIRRLFPTPAIGYLERQEIAERFIKAIYITSHMDDENFDLERTKACCVAVPSADGRLIPTCSYNNFYRQSDPRYFS